MIAVCILCILLVIISFLVIRRCPKDNTTVSSSDDKSTLEFIPDTEVANSIHMPGYQGLIFKHGQLEQKSDLHNPSDNNCLFIMSLYLSDGTLIYQSDYVFPGQTLERITLLQKLEKGTYPNCKLIIECFTNTNEKSQLNGSTQTIEIKSK